MHKERRCVHPDKIKGDTFTFRLIGKKLFRDYLSATLDDFHKRDEDGCRIYKKYRGDDIPVIGPAPKGIGTYEKVRGEPAWHANLWIGKEFVRDVMSMIKKQLYVYMYKYTENRTHWIKEFTVTSKNPVGDLI